MKIEYDIQDININPREVLRYLGYTKEGINDEDIQMVMEELPEARENMRPALCYDRFPVVLGKDGKVTMPYGDIVSHNLSANLSGCNEIIIFAATIGAKYDTYVKRAGVRSMARAAVINSIGAELVENVCDLFNEAIRQELEKEGKSLKVRFSPGYGDLSLENQRGIFAILQPDKHIGLTLKDNLIMAPEKSVTAIIGIY